MHSLYLKEETLETLLNTVRAKKEKGVSLTISVSDTFNKYDQNVVGYVEQSKEQREANVKKYYVGNGRTFWSTNNDHPKPAAKQAAPTQKPVEAVVIPTGQNDGLPW